MASVAQNIKRKKALKAYAITHYISIPRGFGILPGRVGKPARELLRRVQRHAWPTLAPTGEFDEKMLGLLFPPVSVGVHAAQIAGTQLGVSESPAGSNSGPKIREYQNSTNPGQTGFPWCASFVTWCLRQAGWKVSFPAMAYVPAWVALAHAGKSGFYVIDKHEAKGGDIATFDWNHDTVADHIGFLLGPVDSAGNFKTREGNTSDGNNSNGGEVMDRDRNISEVACFIRIA